MSLWMYIKCLFVASVLIARLFDWLLSFNPWRDDATL